MAQAFLPQGLFKVIHVVLLRKYANANVGIAVTGKPCRKRHQDDWPVRRETPVFLIISLHLGPEPPLPSTSAANLSSQENIGEGSFCRGDGLLNDSTQQGARGFP